MIGLKISDLNKKLFICSLGIIILTYGICLLFKNQTVTLKDGFAGEMVPDVIQGNYASIFPANIFNTQLIQSQILSSEGILSNLINGTGQNIIGDAEINTTNIIANTNKTGLQAKADSNKNTMKLSGDGNKNTGDIKIKVSDTKTKLANEIQKAENKLKDKIKNEAAKAEAKAKARSKMQKFSNFKLLAMIGMIYQWGLPFVQCGWYWFVQYIDVDKIEMFIIIYFYSKKWPCLIAPFFSFMIIRVL